MKKHFEQKYFQFLLQKNQQKHLPVLVYLKRNLNNNKILIKFKHIYIYNKEMVHTSSEIYFLKKQSYVNSYVQSNECKQHTI